MGTNTEWSLAFSDIHVKEMAGYFLNKGIIIYKGWEGIKIRVDRIIRAHVKDFLGCIKKTLKIRERI